MPQNHFDEPVAVHHDRSTADMFDAAVLDPTVDFLARRSRPRAGSTSRFGS
jgi:hypothetical protein